MSEPVTPLFNNLADLTPPQIELSLPMHFLLRRIREFDERFIAHYNGMFSAYMPPMEPLDDGQLVGVALMFIYASINLDQPVINVASMYAQARMSFNIPQAELEEILIKMGLPLHK